MYYGVLLCCREGKLLGWASRLLELLEWGSRENQDTWGHHQTSPSATSGELGSGMGWSLNGWTSSFGNPVLQKSTHFKFWLGFLHMVKIYLDKFQPPLHFFVQKWFVYLDHMISSQECWMTDSCSPAVQVGADNRTVYFEPWINAKQGTCWVAARCAAEAFSTTCAVHIVIV